MTSEKPRIFYGWFVVVTALIILMIGYSIRYSFSVFYPYILSEFGWTRASTSLAFSLNLLIYGISSPIVGSFVDRFGPQKVLVFAGVILSAGVFCLSQINALWQLYLLFGVIMAIGINSMGAATHNAYIPNWFVLRRGLAFGILNMGFGAAQVIVGLYQYLITGIDWRHSYMVIAGIPLLVIPLAVFLIRNSPQKMGLLPDGISVDENAEVRQNISDTLIVDKKWAQNNWTLGSALRTRRLWFLFFTFLCASATLNLVVQHQPIHLQDMGFNEIFTSNIMSFFGVGMMVGMLSTSISDKIGRETTFTIATIGVIIGIMAIMFVSQSREWLLYIYVIFFGVFVGAIGPISYSGSADLFAGKHYGAINGFTLLGFGIGGAIGPWIGGYIFDMRGNYNLAFIVAMITTIIACILFWLASPGKVRSVPGRALNRPF